jgi:hypothetical protein
VIVVDASVALAWALPDEISSYADAVLALVETEGVRVPELWPREIANGLAIAYLRARITDADEWESLDGVSRLKIEAEQSSAIDIIRKVQPRRGSMASRPMIPPTLNWPPAKASTCNIGWSECARPPKASQSPGPAGKKALIGYLDPAVSKQLKQTALDGDRTVQDLLAEAVNLLFEKHRKPTIAYPA